MSWFFFSNLRIKKSIQIDPCRYYNSRSTCIECKSAYCLYSSSCIATNSSCKTCTSSDNCKTCHDSYFLDSNGKCLPCLSSNCKKCPNPGDKCENCFDGYYLINYVCEPCNSNCEKCSGSASKCLSCLPGYYLSNS